MLAILILVRKFKKGDEKAQQHIYDLYLKSTGFINNWDLVDVSAEHIVGAYLMDKSKRPLHRLARSNNLWERRMAIMATFHYIKQHEFSETLKISQMLLADSHDLIHKATGWMLREIGKRDLKTEQAFLKKHYKKMPRTMLRYAIEKFPDNKRKRYLRGVI
jgi:3-methyladenine DNA glycosylase AlkD